MNEFELLSQTLTLVSEKVTNNNNFLLTQPDHDASFSHCYFPFFQHSHKIWIWAVIIHFISDVLTSFFHHTIDSHITKSYYNHGYSRTQSQKKAQWIFVIMFQDSTIEYQRFIAQLSPNFEKGQHHHTCKKINFFRLLIKQNSTFLQKTNDCPHLIKIHRIVCINQTQIKFTYYLTFEFTFLPLKSDDSVFPGNFCYCFCNGKKSEGSYFLTAKKVRAVICLFV